MTAVAPVTGARVEPAEADRPPGGDFAALLQRAAQDMAVAPADVDAPEGDVDEPPAEEPLPDDGLPEDDLPEEPPADEPEEPLPEDGLPDDLDDLDDLPDDLIPEDGLPGDGLPDHDAGPRTVTLGEMVQSLADQDSQFVSDLPAGPTNGAQPSPGDDGGNGSAEAATAASSASGAGDRPDGISAEAWEHPAVQSASEYLGVPYKWGGTNPDVGLDCSGLVQRAFRDVGVELPRVSADQSRAGEAVSGGLANARPGDLVYYAGSSTNHIGIYLGEGQMLHAPRRGEDVQVDSVRQSEPTTVRRVM